MISIHDLYTVLSAMVPLYAAMILAYASVRWWKIFTPVQCSGINRFVAVFAVPLLSFHFISTNDPYMMDGPFILADTMSKLAILVLLSAWVRFSRNGSLDWMITLFALATLPNTLVMGIPLLTSMYGAFYGSLMVQLVVLQCVVWYTLMLFLFEFRSARLLVMEQFPDTAASIISFKVESDIMSLDGRAEPLETHANVGEDGKIRVTIRRSVSSRSGGHAVNLGASSSPARLSGLTSMPSSKAITPRPSNLTGAEIYSVYSSRNNTPREYNGMMSSATRALSPRQSFTGPSSDNIYSGQSSRGPTPRASNFNGNNEPSTPATGIGIGIGIGTGTGTGKLSPKVSQISKKMMAQETVTNSSPRLDDDGKELHMFVWSSTTSPVSEEATGHMHMFGRSTAELGSNYEDEAEGPNVQLKELRVPAPRPTVTMTTATTNEQAIENPFHTPTSGPFYVGEDFSFGSKGIYKFPGDTSTSPADKPRPSVSSCADHNNNNNNSNNKASSTDPSRVSPKLARGGSSGLRPKDMPATTVMVKLILRMVGRKLLRNPNTYSSVVGLIWSLIAFRWNISMPKILLNSISILSDAGLGMAMFSLGLFMALQPRLIACGTSLAMFALAVRFLTGPAVMATASISVGLRGVDLRAAIVQAALPQGIVPFVFAREYDLHPDILSTAVIFGMLVALPTTLLYYILLGL